MQIGKLSDLGGVTVEGVDLAAVHTPDEVAALREIYARHGLVVFRDQKLTKPQLMATGDLFGGAMLSRAVIPTDKEAPGISTIGNRGAKGDVIPENPDMLAGKADWHMDLGYVAAPGRGKILYAVQVPEQGGTTGFIDLAVAYDNLPEKLRNRIEHLHVIHNWDKAQVPETSRPDGEVALIYRKFPDVIYPMVRTHPVSGAKLLNCPPLWVTGIQEIPGDEGAALIAEVIAHLTQPKFQYWHSYRVGDALLWDNWRFIHAASGTLNRYARTMWTMTLSAGPDLGRVVEDQAT